MLRKVVHKVSGLCLIAGIVLMLGTAGASDINSIDFKTTVIQAGIALVLSLTGYYVFRLTEVEND